MTAHAESTRPAQASHGWGERLEAGHRRAVVGIALVACLAGLLVPELDHATQFAALAVGVGAFALPHGAVDPWVAVPQDAPRRAWLRFVTFYLALVGLAIAAWIAAPLGTLATFLVASAWHFGQAELDRDRPAIFADSIESLSAGATAILGPLLFRPEETLTLLGMLVDRDLSSIASSAAFSIGLGIWLASRVGSWGHRIAMGAAKRDAQPVVIALGQALWLLSFAVLPVLLAFGLYFCLDHSIRHGIRVAERFDPSSPRRGFALFVARALPATMATLLLAGAAWLSWSPGQSEAGAMQILFVGLAALTLPHVAIGVPKRPAALYESFTETASRRNSRSNGHLHGLRRR